MKNTFRVEQGDSRELLKTLEDSSVDAIVTDPPYEIGFLGRSWDASGIAYDVTFWQECLRVLKPGGHLLAFSAPRTYHRMTCAIEDAGFEIRDQVMWLHSEGMPKGQNLGLQGAKKGYSEDVVETMQGWNSTLKPCHEPIVMARKALVGTIVENMASHGVGGLHVDVCRIPVDWDKDPSNRARGHGFWLKGYERPDDPRVGNGPKLKAEDYDTMKGRYPANVVHDGSEEVLSYFPDTLPCGSAKKSDSQPGQVFDIKAKAGSNAAYIGDEGSAARFFYCAKPKAKERDAGLETKNTHVTVKPTKLMRWLVRLVVPQGATVLDPFTGSGTTGRACILEGMDFIGFELDPDHVEIAQARILDACKEVEEQAPSLFDI